MAKTQHGRDLTGEEMATMLDEFCNSSGQDKFEEFAQTIVFRTHRTLQQKIMGAFVKCIEKWSEAPHDARNEATVSLCKKIVAATGDKYDRHLPYI